MTYHAIDPALTMVLPIRLTRENDLSPPLRPDGTRVSISQLDNAVIYSAAALASLPEAATGEKAVSANSAIKRL